MIAVARPAGPAPMMVTAWARAGDAETDAETDMRGAGRHRQLCRCCGSSAAAVIIGAKNMAGRGAFERRGGVVVERIFHEALATHA